MYDEAGHILGEYTATGALIQETIWMGDTPIATLQPNGSSVAIYDVHTDHLGTPRKITRPSDNGLMWRWDPDTFGTAAPSPTGLGTFNYNLRFSGQYSLIESGLYYNYFRTYDPRMGRYLESDPIGMYGGTNPYVYVLGNPLHNRDPMGLWGGPDIPIIGPFIYDVTTAILEFHYERNSINGNIQPADISGIDPALWDQLPASQAIWHNVGGAHNRKFVTKNGGHCEAVFDSAGHAVTDPRNMASYNYYGPSGLIDGAGHALYDVLPYLVLGNSPDDPTNIVRRLIAPITNR